MVDVSAQGREGTSFRMDIERGKIREFAAATRSQHPAYLDEDAPVIPATFLTTASLWQDGAADPWRALALDQRRGLHAEQEFIFYGPPPRAGDRLTGRSRITEVYQKQGRRGGTLTFAVMVTEFRDKSGRLVAEAKLTGVETSAPAAQPPAAQP